MLYLGEVLVERFKYVLLKHYDRTIGGVYLLYMLVIVEETRHTQNWMALGLLDVFVELLNEGGCVVWDHSSLVASTVAIVSTSTTFIYM